jgi:hypothetical protein
MVNGKISYVISKLALKHYINSSLIFVLLHGDVFRWGFTKNGVFSVGSIYKDLIELIYPIVNNKLIWKMKIPLTTKIFLHGTFIVVLLLRKITLQNATDMVVRNVFSVMKRRQ